MRIYTPLEMVEKWVSETPDRPFLHQPIKGTYNTLTWKQFDAAARKLASGIVALGLPPESKIGIVSKNCAEWIIADIAIMYSGHISVPIYPNVNAKTLQFVLDHSECKLLFVGKLDEPDVICDAIPNHVNAFSFPNLGPTRISNWDQLANDAAVSFPQRDPHDLMTIIYTSGTTGQPKGVMHSFHALSYGIQNAIIAAELKGSSERMLSYLPLSHIAERMLMEFGGIFQGAQIYFAESLDTFADNLRYTKPTLFLGVPRIWTKFQTGILAKMPSKRLNFLLKIPGLNNVIRNKIKAGLGLEKAHLFLTGAAPMPLELLHWYDRLNIRIQEVYGLTENCAYSHFTTKQDIKFGQVGQPLPGVEVRYSDEKEIQVKSPCVMKGYYKNEAKTNETIVDGFLRTGDCGEADLDGNLKITGRVKDMFKSSKGKYISPSPIELEIGSHESIEQVCVVGSSLPQPIALIQLAEFALKESKSNFNNMIQDFLSEVNGRLEKHEQIKKLVVIAEPWTIANGILTPTMKIRRNQLERKYSMDFQEWYDNEDRVLWI